MKLSVALAVLLQLFLLLQLDLPSTLGNHLSLPHGHKGLAAILHGASAHRAHHEHHEQHHDQHEQRELHEHHEHNSTPVAQQHHQQHLQEHHQEKSDTTTTASVQYVHDKDAMPSSSEEDYADSFHNNENYNDFKHASMGAMPTLSQYPWHPYHLATQAYPSMLPPSPPPNVPYQAYPFEHISSIPSPRFLPIFGVPQPVFVPYPFYVPTEMFYPDIAPIVNNDIDMGEAVGNELPTSRAASSRRPVSPNPAYQRNSPIYYVRIPPAPYMFLPSLGLPQPAATANSFGGAFSPYLSYQSLSSLSPYSAIYNLPVNFIANGKPSNMFQIGGTPNELQNPLHFGNQHNNQFNNNVNNNHNYGVRPSQMSSQSHSYRPSQNQQHNNYLSHPSHASIAAQQRPQHDSKMTLLKRPLIFNGRPEEIYILPNNLNSMYSNTNYY